MGPLRLNPGACSESGTRSAHLFSRLALVVAVISLLTPLSVANASLGTFGPASSYFVGDAPSVGDLNRDGGRDLVFAGESDGYINYGDGEGNFPLGTSFGSPEARSIVLGHMDTDP